MFVVVEYGLTWNVSLFFMYNWPYYVIKAFLELEVVYKDMLDMIIANCTF